MFWKSSYLALTANHTYSTSFEVGRQIFWIQWPSTLLIAPRCPRTLCLSTLPEFGSSGRKGMIGTHKSATSFAMISVFNFSTYRQPSVIYGDATLSWLDASCWVKRNLVMIRLANWEIRPPHHCSFIVTSCAHWLKALWRPKLAFYFRPLLTAPAYHRETMLTKPSLWR